MSSTLDICRAAKAAAPSIAAMGDEKINAALGAMARALIEDTDKILAANAEDIIAASGTVSEVMLDRLRLSRERIAGMAKANKKKLLAFRLAGGVAWSEQDQAYGYLED